MTDESVKMNITLPIRLLVILVIFSVSAVEHTLSKNYIFADDEVDISFPDKWIFEYSEDDGFLYCYAPDEDFTILVTIMNDDSLQMAIESIETNLQLDLINVDLFRKDSIKVSGMEAITGEGTVMLDEDTENIIRFILIQLPNGRIIYAYGTDYPDIIQFYKKDIERIFKSIKPLAN